MRSTKKEQFIGLSFNKIETGLTFAEKGGAKAASQIRAFDDAWTWDQEDEAVFAQLVTDGRKVADVLQAFRARNENRVGAGESIRRL